MSILKKLLLTIMLSLGGAFVVMTVIGSYAVIRSNNAIVDAFAERLEKGNRQTAELVEASFSRVENDLDVADAKIHALIENLYADSFTTLNRALANQIYPMVESFNFDAPAKIIENLRKSNAAISGVRFAISETPSPQDVFTFGTLAERENSKQFSHEIRGDYAYLNVEMMVDMTGMEAIRDVRMLFEQINADNAALAKSLVAHSREELEQTRQFAAAEAKSAQREQILLNALMMAVALVAVCGLIGWFIQRLVARPMARTVHMIKELEAGHLGVRLDLQSSDEIGQMARTMDAFADSLEKEIVSPLQRLAAGDLTFRVNPRDENDSLRGALRRLGKDLNELLGQVNLTSQQVEAGSTQVSDSSQALSQGAAEQASSLEEITSSMTEMGGQTSQNAENASQANGLAVAARTSAEEGNRQMQEMLAAMSDIDAAGANISKIIKTIDEIAFQTNLLALNAAVEAARAGQHGKGFAVVAEEVRNLAARSATAARETAELIEGSVEKTANGTRIARHTAEALKEISGNINQTADLVSEIAAASNEQAQGIAQVNQGLGQIDRVTQQNTAGAEESAAAAEQLLGQAAELRRILKRFKLRERGDFASTVTVGRPEGEHAAGKWGSTATSSAGDVASPPKIALDDSEFGKF